MRWTFSQGRVFAFYLHPMNACSRALQLHHCCNITFTVVKVDSFFQLSRTCCYEILRII